MINAKRFVNKHIIITGAARGIGLEIARQFANEGAALSIVDYNSETLVKASEELQHITTTIHTYHADVSNRQMVNDAVTAAENIQPIDILINNAGIASETPFLQIEECEWTKIIDINLTGMFHLAQAVCRCMVKRKKGVVPITTT